MTDVIQPDQITSPHLRAMLDLWRAKRRDRGGALPARSDLRPEEMVAFLPFVALISVVEDPRRFQFRLVGTGIVACMGRETTNRWVEDPIFADKAAVVGEFFSLPVDTRQPARAAGRYVVTTSRRVLGFETVLAPLCNGGGGVDMLLGGLVGEPLAHDERIKQFDYETVATIALHDD